MPEQQPNAPFDPPPEAAATPAERGKHRRAWLLAMVLGLPLAGVAAIDLMVSLSTRAAISERLAAVEPVPVALILGTSRYHKGGRNAFYHARIDAAVALYEHHLVRGILVSGDNATRYYNEPVTMQRDLIARGVPAEHITLDYAGFRTLDSIVRAKEVFGLDRLLVVSQRFHAARAIFLARHFGIDARGFAAASPEQSGLMTVRAREVLARAAAVMDLLTGRGPRFLGERETVRLRAAPPTGASA